MKIGFFINSILLAILCLGFSSNSHAQIDSGYVHLQFNLPESYFLVIDDNFQSARLVQPKDRIAASVGYRKFTLVSKFIDDYTFHLTVKEGLESTYNYTFEKFRIDHASTYNELINQENLVIYTDSLSTIYLNDKQIGLGHSSSLVNPGWHTIRSVHPKSGSFTRHVKIEYAETKFIESYNASRKIDNPLFYLLPGSGYIINEQKDKALATYFSMGGLLVSYFSLDYKIRDDQRQYDYNHSNLDRLKKASLVGLIATYLFTTIDGYRKPKGGFPGNSVDLNLKQLDRFTNNSMSATLTLNFK